MATGGNVPDPNKPKSLKTSTTTTTTTKKPAKPAPEKFAPKGKKT